MRRSLVAFSTRTVAEEEEEEEEENGDDISHPTFPLLRLQD